MTAGSAPSCSGSSTRWSPRSRTEPAPELAPAEVRAPTSPRRLEGRPTRANFRTGHLTVCTLMPMRSVPHRVVCLLGLDDGAFPRKAPRDGDDLMLADPHVGERDPRSEDRQLLLDALLAATERLIVTYTGNDERTNTARPPAVPVGELLDAVDATVRCDDGAARGQRSDPVRHPLQPFDPRNFVAVRSPARRGALTAVALEGARALVGPRRPAAPFLAAPLPGWPSGGRRARRPRRASSSIRCARSCASGWGSASTTSPTRSTTRCRSSSTASSAGASASGCSRRACAGRRRAARSRPRSPAGRCRPACSGKPVIDSCQADRRPRSRPRRTRLTPGGRRARSDRRARRAGRRPACSTAPSPGSAATLLLTTTYSRVARQAPDGRLGAAAGPHGRTARRGRSRRRRSAADRAATTCGRAIDRAVSADPDERAAAGAATELAVLIDLYDRGHARAAADVLPDLGRLGGGACRRAGSRAGGPQRVGERLRQWG